MIGLRQQSLCWRKLSYLLELFEQVNTTVENSEREHNFLQVFNNFPHNRAKALSCP